MGLLQSPARGYNGKSEGTVRLPWRPRFAWLETAMAMWARAISVVQYCAHRTCAASGELQTGRPLGFASSDKPLVRDIYPEPRAGGKTACRGRHECAQAQLKTAPPRCGPRRGNERKPNQRPAPDFGSRSANLS